MDGGKLNVQLPEAFLNRIRQQLGDEFPLYLKSIGEKSLRGVRINPYKRPPDSFFTETEGLVSWASEAFYLKYESKAGTTVAHEAGAFYLQEPSAMIPASVMNARPGEKILDLCAAPGGKSTQMAADMKGEGLLVCNEPVAKRAVVLSRNIERMGIPNAVVTNAWPEKLAEKWPDGFDGVLVDAPCSGEGMFRRHPETRSEWSPEKASGCAGRQTEILEAAAGLVRAGGRIVYSTCTMNPEENEVIIKHFTEKHPEFVREAFQINGKKYSDGMMTCWPHREKGEGQFAALLRRQGTGTAKLQESISIPPISRNGLSEYCRYAVTDTLPTHRIGGLYICMGNLPELAGIRFLRLGLHIGEIREKHFVPDHAHAIAWKPPQNTIKEITGEEALKYMRGDTLEGEEQGWCLIRYQGLILGWGKGTAGTVKNHYPKGLRCGGLIL